MTKQQIKERLVEIVGEIMHINCAERNYKWESKRLPSLYEEQAKLRKELEDESITRSSS